MNQERRSLSIPHPTLPAFDTVCSGRRLIPHPIPSRLDLQSLFQLAAVAAFGGKQCPVQFALSAALFFVGLVAHAHLARRLDRVFEGEAARLSDQDFRSVWNCVVADDLGTRMCFCSSSDASSNYEQCWGYFMKFHRVVTKINWLLITNS